MRAGRLSSRIEFLRRTDAKDEYGQKTNVLDVILSRKADVSKPDTLERNIETGNYSVLVHTFRVRFDKKTGAIRYADKIRFNGLDFEITSIENVRNLNRELLFTGAHNDRNV